MDKRKNIPDLVRQIHKRKYPETLQEIKPVFRSVNKDMVQCNFDIDPDLKKQLKMKALKEDKTIKEVITAALTAYLNRSGGI